MRRPFDFLRSAPMTISIRPATEQDCALILRFITELAVYEKAADQVEATVETLASSLFGAGTPARALICEADGQPVATPSISSTTRPGRPGKGCTWKTCTSRPPAAASAPASACCAIWRGSRSRKAAAASNGACWTGTSRPSTSTSRSARAAGRVGALPHARRGADGLRRRLGLKRRAGCRTTAASPPTGSTALGAPAMERRTTCGNAPASASRPAGAP